MAATGQAVGSAADGMRGASSMPDESPEYVATFMQQPGRTDADMC